jgi:hypothetical protein
MKLLRYGPNGHEMPGLLDDNGIYNDLSGEVRDISEQMLLPLSLDRLKRLDVNSLPLVAGEPRIGACVGRVGEFICIGLNYSDHAAEAFAVCGPNDNIVIPLESTKTDWEIELGVIAAEARQPLPGCFRHHDGHRLPSRRSPGSPLGGHTVGPRRHLRPLK